MVNGGQGAGALAGFFQQSEQLFGKKKTSYVTSTTEPDSNAPTAQHDDQEQQKRTTESNDQSNSKKENKKAKKKNKKQKKQQQAEAPNTSESNEPSTGADDVDDAKDETKDSSESTQSKHQQPEADQQEEQDPEKSVRTVFVGNVSLDATTKDLKQFFSSCGKVENVRLRSLPVAGCKVDQHGNQKLMKKVCANKKLFSETADSCNAYVLFAAKESVEEALKRNGAMFYKKKLHVDRENPVMDPKRSVFVGNLPFRTDEDAVRNFFEKNMRKLMPESEESEFVEQVRIIRDRETGMTKGFCYVRFKDMSMAAKALGLNNSKLQNRELRVSVCGKRFKNKKGEEDVRKKYQGLKASAGAAARIKLKRNFAEAHLAKEANAKPKKPKHAARKARQQAEAEAEAEAKAKAKAKAKAATKAKAKAKPAAKAKAKAKAEPKAKKQRSKQ